MYTGSGADGSAIRPCRFFFYSAYRDEPPRIHVEREDSEAKFWLDPVEVEWNRDFARYEVRRIEGFIDESAEFLLREWHEYFEN